MDSKKLNQEEKEILESVERGEWQSSKNLSTEKKHLREIARATFRKDSRINIRISSKDLDALQKRAIEEGLPYQTLIASVLHKYASGRLVERFYEERQDLIPQRSIQEEAGFLTGIDNDDQPGK
jgi:predicted DNA binding CopG/RHH family protein